MLRRKLCAGLIWLAADGSALAQATSTTRADDSAIHLSSADAGPNSPLRSALTQFIWGSSRLPGSLPALRRTLPSSPVQGLGNLHHVEAMRVDMELGESALVYLFVPSGPSSRLVIVHHGHECALDDGPGSGRADAGIQRTIRTLLAQGFAVLAANMPRYQPGNSALGIAANCGGDHAGLMALRPVRGSPIKFFLEPIVAAINALQGHFSDFNMVGLSGGGWTTNLLAALDPRIKLSFPVAGSVPLYLRVEPYQSHDIEQFLSSLYGQRSPAVAGVAGYLDLYALGALGADRGQFQILNRHDNCCFGEAQHNAAVLGASFDDALRGYERAVLRAVRGIGAGRFQLIIDEVPGSHMISDSAISNVILPALRGQTPLSTTIHIAGGNLCFDVPDFGRAPLTGDPLQVWPCHGQANQQFDLRPGGSLQSRLGDFCLAVSNQPPAQAHDRVQVSTCDGSMSQQFALRSDRGIQTASGLCLQTVSAGATAQAADRVELVACAGARQQFHVNRELIILPRFRPFGH